MKILLSLLLLMGLLIGCTEKTSGPVEIHWDRDTCDRCRMVLSDPHHAAQVRYRDEKNKSQVARFDDIGCAVIWLKDKPWRDAPSTEIWVNDHRNGHWINAKTAYYVTGQLTPMEYGLGAQSDPAPGALNFNAAREHIYSIELHNNRHGGTAEQPSHTHQPTN